ncbi:MAG: RNA pseudouridine synthase [Planctomycetaceae bacterium]
MSESSENAATPLDVLCEDGPVIAVNKPSGVITQGAPIGVTGLIDMVKGYIAKKYNKPGNVYLGVPHRLDRPVSGVVVFSRNSKCAARLSEQFANRQVKKVYRAVLERPPAEPVGTLEDWIFRIEGEPRVELVREGHPQGKHARLHYRTLATSRGRALVEVELETGRMHQIRIQFASRGCPIVGDLQYGATTQFGPQTGEPRDRSIALHAWSLTILHPVRYDELTITAPAPPSWNDFSFSI